ncbi:MAG: chromosomal replication initiator protein DnaA [Bacteroidales bacterium]|nr:chromosomal replication initiator protein DnaA [Bacteroidales bacterium]
MQIEGRHIAAWEECLRIISQNIEPQQFATWFKPIRPVSLENSELMLEVPSHWFIEYLESSFIDIMRKTLRRVLGPDVKLRYVIRPVSGQPEMKVNALHGPVPENNEVAVNCQPSSNPGPFVYPGIHKVKINPRLNPEYCFENLVEGECNKMAYTAGVNISNAPGKTPFNPLFIFGGPGLGKTHIAQAIGIAIKDKYPDLVVLYVTGNEFKTQYMDAVTVRNKLTDFLAYYMKIDVLIVDDIQDLAGKSSQNAFFNIFNYLHQNGKQLILTSDRAPADLQNFEERLLSRFKWGLAVELSHPDYNTRLSMLRSRCDREGIIADDELLEYLATNIRTNFRELEGVLMSVIAHSAVYRNVSQISLAEKLVGNIVGEQSNDISIEKIKQTVCEYFNISDEAIISNTRKRQIVQARQIAMYICRNLIYNCSLSTIGAELGGKDHATVMHACTTVGDLMVIDRTFKKYVTDIEQMLSSRER